MGAAGSFGGDFDGEGRPGVLVWNDGALTVRDAVTGAALRSVRPALSGPPGPNPTSAVEPATTP